MTDEDMEKADTVLMMERMIRVRVLDILSDALNTVRPADTEMSSLIVAEARLDMALRDKIRFIAFDVMKEYLQQARSYSGILQELTPNIYTTSTSTAETIVYTGGSSKKYVIRS